MVESLEEEEEAPAAVVVKKNYRLPKRKRVLSRHRNSNMKKKRPIKDIAVNDNNDSDSLSGDSLPIAKALRRSPPTREPLREISPTTVSQQKPKRSITMNSFPIKIP
jgi:hypothetical protein